MTTQLPVVFIRCAASGHKSKEVVDMGKVRLLTSVAVMVAMLAAALPATAFADSKTSVSCILAVQVVAPGIDVVKEKKEHFVIRNSGQVLAGTLDCGVIGVIDSALDGIVSTLHGSKVKDNGKDGAFEGKIRGQLTLVPFADPTNPLTGKLRAKVSGMMAMPGVPATVFTETVTGNLKLKGVDIKVKIKDFSITLGPDTVKIDPATGFPLPLIGTEVDGDPVAPGVQPIPTLAGATTPLEGQLKTNV